jgi:hypothetical protein
MGLGCTSYEVQQRLTVIRDSRCSMAPKALMERTECTSLQDLVFQREGIREIRENEQMGKITSTWV